MRAITTEPGKLRIVEVGTVKEVRVLDLPRPSWSGVAAISPDGTWVAAGTTDSNVAIYQMPGGKLVKTISVGDPRGEGLCFRPDGKRLAIAGGGGLRVWDVGLGKVVRVEKLESTGSRLLCWSSDGRTVYVARGREVEPVVVGE